MQLKFYLHPHAIILHIEPFHDGCISTSCIISNEVPRVDTSVHTYYDILFLIFLQNQVTTYNILKNFEVAWSLHTEKIKFI